MSRVIITALALAALSLTPASGSPRHPARGHRDAVSAPLHHKQHRRPAARTPKHITGHSSGRKASLEAAPRLAASQNRRQVPTAKPLRSHPTAQPPSLPSPEPVAQQRPIEIPASFVRTPQPFLPPLRGNHDSLVRQNQITDAEGLERIEDDDDLDDRIARKMLVPLPASAALTVNPGLPEDRRYCRPWTATFLSDLARAHGAEFRRPLEVSSAVRTVEYQKRLMAINGNAAAAEGDIASPHLTGGSIDIAKNGLSRQEIGWMRARLLALQLAGKIDVEEEFHQSCFHITVYKSYEISRPASASTAKPATGKQTTAPSKPAEPDSQPQPDAVSGGIAVQGR